jgi:hypothetical protein
MFDINNYMDSFWGKHSIPAIIDYIKTPNKSPNFGPNWENGHMERMLKLA